MCNFTDQQRTLEQQHKISLLEHRLNLGVQIILFDKFGKTPGVGSIDYYPCNYQTRLHTGIVFT